MDLKDWIYKYDTPNNRKELERGFQDSGPLSDFQLHQLMSDNYVKYEGAGYLLLHTDLERLKNKIPELLTWIQDMNWPAAFNIHQLLVLFGEDLIDPVKKAFNNNPSDSIWQNNMIWILSKIDSSRLTELKDELVNTVEKADQEGAAISALELLFNKNIINDTESFVAQLTEKYKADESMIEDIEELKEQIKAHNN